MINNDGDVEAINICNEEGRYLDKTDIVANVVELASSAVDNDRMFYKMFQQKELMLHQAEDLPVRTLRNGYISEETNFKETVSEISVSDVPKGAIIKTSHVIYNVKQNDDGSLKMKAQIAPHGNKDKYRSRLRSD